MISRSLPVIGSVPFLVPPREETTRNPQAREKHKQPPEAPAPNQTSDSHQLAEQSTTEDFVRKDAATSHPSGSTEPAISYTVHTKMHQHVLDQSAEEVENLAPSIVAPGNRRSPTIRLVTKYTTKCPADAWLLMQGPQPQNIEEEMTKLVQDPLTDHCRFWGRCPFLL